MLLLPWIKEGNEPDRFTQFQDNNGKNIYENDILDWGENIVGQVCYGHKGWEFRYWHDDPRSFSFDDNGNYIYDKVEEIVSLDEVCMGGAIIVSIISNTHKIPGDMANSND